MPEMAACMAWPLGAQAAATDTPPPDAQAQIDVRRGQAMAGFDVQEADCYTHFAVSDCLKRVQSQRRAVQADLKREEATLHEQARQQAAQREPLRTREGEPDAAIGASTADKLQAQRDKQAAHTAKPTAPSRAASVPAGLTAAQESENRARYARKQADAQARRAAVEKRLSERKGQGAAPLPVPN